MHTRCHVHHHYGKGGGPHISLTRSEGGSCYIDEALHFGTQFEYLYKYFEYLMLVS